jgi:hypothetical protein
VNQVLEIVYRTQIEVRQGQDSHEREKSVLEAGRFLEHKRLAAW